MKRVMMFCAGLLAAAAMGEPLHLYVDCKSEYSMADGSNPEKKAITISKVFETINSNNGARALDGAIIHVAPGTYAPAKSTYHGHGTPTIFFKIIGEGTAENPVIIDGGGTNACITLYESHKRISVENIVFRNGSGKCGGGISCDCSWTDSGVDSVVDCTFENCRATNGSGGAVYSYEGTTVMTNCVFRNCQCAYSGQGGGTDLDTCRGLGGAVALDRVVGDCDFVNCTFENCYTPYSGGAISVSYPVGDGSETLDIGMHIIGCTFTGNHADENAGAVMGIVRECRESEFVNNSAGGNGSVWYLDGYRGSSASGNYVVVNRFTDCVFRGNEAIQNGTSNDMRGGVFACQYRKEFVFERCTFAENKCAVAGAVLGKLGYCVMNDCVISNNTGVGCVVMDLTNKQSDYHARFTGCTFADNNTGANSTVYSNNRLFMERCKFERNTGYWAVQLPQSSSAGVYTNHIANCLFHHNVNTNEAAGSGGAIKIFWQPARAMIFLNNTMADNRSATGPYAILVDSWDSENNGCLYANNVFYHNRSLAGEGGAAEPAMVTKNSRNNWYEQNNTSAKNTDNGCIIGTDPRFRTEEGMEYVPQFYSQLRNAGAPLDWTAMDIDLAGRGRINGEAVDIGAYECWSPTPATRIFIR